MAFSMPNLRLTSERAFRLVSSADGRHRFGGPARHKGIFPNGSDVPLQLVVELDLTDEQVPIAADRPLNSLPLLYPFKYSGGGPVVQYSVISDSEIRILYMSDATADDPESQYLQVCELPSLRLELVPLNYEQARVIAYRYYDAYFAPDEADGEILRQLNYPFHIMIGGRRPYIINSGDIICHNPECQYHQRRVWFKCLAMIPPIPVNGDTSFWYEFEGGVSFCFGMCYCCGTMIAFNVCS